MRSGRRRRVVVASVASAAVLSVVAGMGAADAAATSLDSGGLASGARAWGGFSNDVSGGFGYDDAALISSRYATDAYDTGLVLLIDGTAFWDEDNEGDFNSKTQTISVGPTTLSGLKVSRVDTAKGPFLRTLVRLKNPSTTAVTVNLSWNSNLGSDGSGVVNSSSSGDNHSFERSDRWMVTSDPTSNGWDEDPSDAFVYYGKNAAVRPSAVVATPDSGDVDVDYSVKVPAGKTKYLLFYAEIWDTPGHAKSSMAKYDKQGLSSKLLSGISSTVRSQVVNWKL